MSRRIYDTPFAALVPESIRDDATIRASADALDPALGSLVRGVPDLLLFSRLDPTPGQLSPVMQRLTDAAGGLKPLSEVELELLAWQFHVDFREVARNRDELASMVRQSIPWHRIKGTPASIRAALALFGFGSRSSRPSGMTPSRAAGAQQGPRSLQATAHPTQDAWGGDIIIEESSRPSGMAASRAAGAQQGSRSLQATASVAQDVRPSDIIIEEDGKGKHWATYQLGLPEIADMDTVRLVYRVAREMQPARCRLWRMYSGYDRRPIIWSGGTEHDRWSEGWWTKYSGVSVPGITEDDENDLIVSFGAKRSFQTGKYVADEICCSFGTTSIMGILAPYIDRPIWSLSSWGDQYPQNHGFAIGSLFSILWAERATVARTWQGEWDERRWLDYIGFDRKLPRWRMGIRNFSKSQSVYSECDKWGDINCCYSRPVFTVLDAPPVWGASDWSEDALHPREIVVHEQFIVTAGLSVPPLTPGDPGVAMASRLSVATDTPDPERVRTGLHESRSMATASPEREAPRAARGELLGSTSEPPNLPDPSSAVSTYQAPLWDGAWKDADRTWKTSPKLFIQ